MKNIFNKRQLNNICISVLIVLFSCLIIYQIYLAINNKQGKKYSKLIEGFSMSTIIPQGYISCTSVTSLPNNFYTYVITDISNIEIIYDNVNGIAGQVNGLISNYNSSQTNTSTSINNISLNTLTSPTISSSSNNSDLCNAININVNNISTINGYINTINNVLPELPNGEKATITSLNNNSSVNPCSPLQKIPISNLCQTENTNITNINHLNANTISLYNSVSSLQSAQTSQVSNAYPSATGLSSTVGINTN
jgi:hypothetical protein